MSVIENIQKRFKPKSVPFEDSMDMGSVGAPVDVLATAAMDEASMRIAASRQPDSSQDAFSPSRLVAIEDEVPPARSDLLALPLLGRRTIDHHQKILAALLVLALFVLGIVTFLALRQAETVAQEVAATGESLMQSQRLAKSVSQALVGSPQAFPDVRESSEVLAKRMRGLKSGDDSLPMAAVSDELQPHMEKIIPFMERAEKNAKIVMDQQTILKQVGSALRTINRQSSDLLEIAETVLSLKLQQNAVATEISAAGQLVMLTQRIGKSANEFLTMEGVSPEAVFLLGKDLNSFKEIAQGLQDGSPELRLSGSKDPQTRERLQALMVLYEQTRVQAGAILGNLQGLVSAREAQSSIISDSEPLRLGLEELQGQLSSRKGLSVGALTTLLIAARIRAIPRRE